MSSCSRSARSFSSSTRRTAFIPCSSGPCARRAALYVDPYGYPTFLLKILNVILAGLWLIVNHVDNRAYDYPLIRKKYALLLILAPLILAESIVQTLYFTQMKADVITSCCGSLFSSEGSAVSSDIAALPAKVAMAGFSLVFALTFLLGGVYRLRGKWGGLFSFASGLFFLVACVSFISFISLYFYELPTHHCPFCVLQREYGYIGYLLYATLLTGVVSRAWRRRLDAFPDDRQSCRHPAPDPEETYPPVPCGLSSLRGNYGSANGQNGLYTARPPIKHKKPSRFKKARRLFSYLCS